MEMRIDELKVMVRSRLDELGANESDMMDVETDHAELDSIIRDSATGALRHLLMVVDGNLVTGVPCEADVEISSDGVGVVRVPDDCLRVLNIRLKSWRGAAPSLVAEESAVALMQYDKYARGIPERPVAVVVNRQDGRYVELYSTEDMSDSLSGFNYLRVPIIYKDPIGDEVIDVPDVLKDAFVYRVAGMTAVSYGDAVLGEKLFGIADSMV